MVWDGGRRTPIPSETFPAVPSTYLFDFLSCTYHDTTTWKIRRTFANCGTITGSYGINSKRRKSRWLKSRNLSPRWKLGIPTILSCRTA